MLALSSSSSFPASSSCCCCCYVIFFAAHFAIRFRVLFYFEPIIHMYNILVQFFSFSIFFFVLLRILPFLMWNIHIRPSYGKFHKKERKLCSEIINTYLQICVWQYSINVVCIYSKWSVLCACILLCWILTVKMPTYQCAHIKKFIQQQKWLFDLRKENEKEK